MLVTFVTPIRNVSPRYFRDCAFSVSAFATDSEWIIIDDGSSDENRLIYLDIVTGANLHIPWKYGYLQGRNGISKSRNLGLAEAKGEWVVALDGDDCISEVLVNSLRRMEDRYTLACFASEFFGDWGCQLRRATIWEQSFRAFGGTWLDPFLWFDFYYHGVIARRVAVEGVGGYASDLMVGEDQDILLKICDECGVESVFFCDRVGYRYRDNPAGVCAAEWDMVEKNYCLSMLRGALRRGADVSACKFSGQVEIEGVEIDRYTYCKDGKWLEWRCLTGKSAWAE